MRVFDEDRIAAPPGVDDQPGPRRSMPNKSQLAWLGIGLAIVLAVVAVIRAGDRPSTLSPQQIGTTVDTAVDNALAAAQNVPPPGQIAFQTILPSMVYISTTRPGAGSDGTASGAGVIVDANGQILTARHVVTGADSIEVTFADGTKSPAKIVSEQPANDIAVLVPDQPPSVIVPAVLGGGVQIGDEVYATGHPFDLVDSLTAGVVSGLDRTVPIADGEDLTGLIQFDAAVNPGNSGGPLLNEAGQIVGIVTALANPAQQGFFVGIGFAVPISTAGGAAGAPQR